MATKIDWYPSPAKLNLFLHINGRYENGYHQLQSLFQMLDYGDELGFQVNSSNMVTLHKQIDGVPEQENLIYKAAMLLKPYAAESAGCIVHLKKRLAMGGGIGGGSSNAATVLLVLNKLWKCELSNADLAKLGLTLGADVPVFVQGKTAFAQGVGEILVPVKLPTKWYLVATPQVHVSTQAIFTHPDLPRSTPKIEFSDYSFEGTHNDCETLVSKLHKEVASLLQWLLHYAPSRMTGTGASVFAVFNAKEDAQNVLDKLPSHYTGFVAKGVNHSGIHKAL
ncbi:4-(cytidine 5'-diphospho)-2-C-methyl-D-erythritol kinase [Glaciecola sp. MH2013]|uniref:4-(cytidine 5'-diphospho)-2-C-methyl-D-erythritol kinase n=1 Tax=Glaciecola sp. MH2013 TaxID=2785524 RepID=UPI00189DB17E|nr:4-(cytidine 5'-diphospho)-2-C-methyl-D-erythritol kinase [Glaciecola sp. MH2013]MBF7072560.1 4-(cytidine 5'-diphospho)-2-C-methyl-D-erythritol kinase [Glaciecola sp. MH2013]